MKITAVNILANNINITRAKKQTLQNCDAKTQTQKTYTSENIRANYAPLSFKGNANQNEWFLCCGLRLSNRSNLWY